VIVSDGDLMEGISHEAASLAGHLRLGRLVALHDDNRITIDGPSSLATSEDVGARFAAYGWRVFRVEDGNDLVAIGEALERAASSEDAPALVQVRTHIGFGSPHKQDTSESHGAPLGTEEAAATRRALGWELAEPFAVPAEILDHARRQAEAGREERKRWSAALERFRIANPDLAAELERRWRGEPPPLPTALAEFGAVRNAATREASGAVLNAVAAHVPELAGGSADLAGSNSSTLKGVASIAPGDYAGRNLHFGVREHAMAAIANGIALHRGFRPYVATFLIFSDYLKPALRLSALMRLPVIYLFTHDSVAVGEDGPTHQPIEQLAALRSIPGLTVVRPADAWETEQAWRFALEHTGGPTALVLSRQKLPVLDRPTPGALARGAYVRAEASSGVPEAVLFASGSEVALALAARDLLEASGVPTRVVSAPSLELFAAQDRSYRDGVTGPSDALRVAVEMAHPQGWHGVVGAQGVAVGIERFGASAPGDEVAARLGFTPQAIVERVRSAVAERQPTQIASAVPRKVEGAVAGRRARLESLHAESRLAARDASLWGER
ncbi:MAG: transketolase family protein, partial [Acidobacteriota bacterium]